jgi:heme/copper-type cytochrome/quinol oxidase subunit 3
VSTRTPRAAIAQLTSGGGPSTAWWGMAMLLVSEGMLFGAMIAGYYYLRLQADTWPPAGVPEPPVAVPLILVGVLALTSIPMQLASGAAEAGRRRTVLLLLLAAFVVQSGYLAYELHSYAGDLGSFAPSDHAYGSIYFVLLGADHAHVFLGLLFDLWLALKLSRGLTAYRRRATQAIALYWHGVNLLTLIVIGVILSARL